MSSPQEVASKVWGGKPKDWEVIDDLEGIPSIEEFRELVLTEIDKLLSTQSIDDTEMLLELRERIEKL